MNKFHLLIACNILFLVFVYYQFAQNSVPEVVTEEKIIERIIEKPVEKLVEKSCPNITSSTKTTQSDQSTPCWGQSKLQQCPKDITSWNKDDSKGQVGQDTKIYDRYFKNKCYGTFLEMGALDGVTFSNSYFYERVLNWRGVCVEPNPINYDKLMKNRPVCIDINAAVTSTRGMLKFMQVEGYADALSGIVDAYDEKHLQRVQNEIESHGGKSTIIGTSLSLSPPMTVIFCFFFRFSIPFVPGEFLL
eukprot:Phypoly_transcript_13342.p1 GENE.Phypoly_transcript_13342~~Phypoly_transcript_13342.p1  ORF type:complete len:266 (+),score=29.40 Phypoly_transcript_13342:59-799(+)